MNNGFILLNVSQLNMYVRSQIESDPNLYNVFVRGEISNFVNHYRSGHFYMSLKDENAVIKAVMFKTAATRLRFLPENGMKVIVMGRVSIYERDGQYQFYIEDMQPDGVGAVYTAFEQLKDKLSKEGLFDEARKKTMPRYPRKIGIITSPTGAALQDILNILKRRWPVADISVYPVLVQGGEAPEHICRALRYFNDKAEADVIILGRGGGSIEELWSFNDESVARAIAVSAIPIVSAVGHETDYTIADFAADLRAPTPSAAAELVTPDKNAILEYINSLDNKIERHVSNCLVLSKQRYVNLSQSRALKDPMTALMIHREKLSALLDRVIAASGKITLSQNNKFIALAAKLDALSPLKVLSRGYSIASDINGGIIAGIDDLQKDQNISLRLTDGQTLCKVIETSKI